MGKKKKAEKSRLMQCTVTPFTEEPVIVEVPSSEDRQTTYIEIRQDRNGTHYRTLYGEEAEKAAQSPAMRKMQEWIENGYAGDRKVEAALHPLPMHQMTEPAQSFVRDNFGGPGWRETMKTMGFNTGATSYVQGEPEVGARNSIPHHTHETVDETLDRTLAGVTDQPAPVPNDAPSAHDLVIKDMLQRKEFGLQKYGTLLQPGNGRKTLRDAYEEILDLAAYLRCVIAEQESGVTENLDTENTERLS
jgi:hypothetical protein